MHSFFEDYISNLLELHNDIRNAIQGLSQAALDWIPNPEMNSINVLVVHLVGAERYWLGDVLLGELSGRDREAEFRTSGLTEKELVQRLAEIEIYVKIALDGLTLEDLNRKRISPRNRRQVTIGYLLPYVLKHTALHLGHIQITRQLWKQHMPRPGK